MDKRFWVQSVFSFLTNAHISGFFTGIIYTGLTKYLCLPGLSCYSCPGSLGSCPIGAMQSVLGSREFGFSFYITGFLTAVGALSGRFVCGWLCPFGLFEDLLYKIPFPFKYRSGRRVGLLRFIKYIILIIFGLLFPIFIVDIIGQGQPGFCKWICPSGTLMAGWPLAIVNDGIKASLGMLFAWKSFILIALIILSVVIYRPFCRFLCPLGAIYGLFNPISFYRYRINRKKCNNCGVCSDTCKVGLDVCKNPNSTECIRCGECITACPTQAIERKGLQESSIRCMIV